MNQRKPNNRNRYSLVLLMLLCVGLLVTATGTAFARYQAEKNKEIGFRVRVPDQIQLGVISLVPEETEPTDQTQNPETVDDTELPTETEPPILREVFTPKAQLAWETEDGITQLNFAVANGTSEKDYSRRDQVIRLRMIGTLGIWDGTQTPKLTITLPPSDERTQELVVTATVTPFAEGSVLKQTYGAGWLYTFLDEENNELTWKLPGGDLSYVTLTVIMEGEIPENVNLLQPYVVAELLQE